MCIKEGTRVDSDILNFLANATGSRLRKIGHLAFEVLCKS